MCSGNENNVNLLKLVREKIVKTHEVNLIWAGFSHLKPQCSSRALCLDQVWFSSFSCRQLISVVVIIESCFYQVYYYISEQSGLVLLVIPDLFYIAVCKYISSVCWQWFLHSAFLGKYQKISEVCTYFSRDLKKIYCVIVNEVSTRPRQNIKFIIICVYLHLFKLSQKIYWKFKIIHSN